MNYTIYDYRNNKITHLEQIPDATMNGQLCYEVSYENVTKSEPFCEICGGNHDETECDFNYGKYEVIDEFEKDIILDAVSRGWINDIYYFKCNIPRISEIGVCPEKSDEDEIEKSLKLAKEVGEAHDKLFLRPDEIDHERKTLCVFHTPTYHEIAVACDGYDNLYPKDEFIIDIIDGRTGEVLANRDEYGLWEINI